MRFTFDSAGQVEDLVFIVDHLNALCVSVVPHTEGPRDGRSKDSRIQRSNPCISIF